MQIAAGGSPPPRRSRQSVGTGPEGTAFSDGEKNSWGGVSNRRRPRATAPMRGRRTRPRTPRLRKLGRYSQENGAKQREKTPLRCMKPTAALGAHPRADVCRIPFRPAPSKKSFGRTVEYRRPPFMRKFFPTGERNPPVRKNAKSLLDHNRNGSRKKRKASRPRGAARPRASKKTTPREKTQAARATNGPQAAYMDTGYRPCVRF